MTVVRLERAKRAFFTALSIDMAVTVVVVASDFWIVGVLNAVAAGGPPAGSSVVGRIQFLESFSGVLILTMLGVGWTLIRWLDACYAHAKDTLRARGLQHEKWKTWGWMVPFLNLFKPYQVLSEIYKVATAGAGRDDWKKASGSVALLAWWIYWTVAHLVMVMVGKEVLNSSRIEGLTLHQIVGIKEAQIALCLISLSVAGLWFAVAGNLTSRLVSGHPKSARGVASSSSPVVADVRAGNDAYAAAMAEIEEGRLDKGVWARSFAEAGGDEPKAKALYIKARAEAEKDAVVWEDTQPPKENANSIKVATAEQSDFKRPPPQNGPMSATVAFSLVGVVVIGGILAAFVLPVNQDNTKQQRPGTEPVQAPASQVDWSQFKPVQSVQAPTSQAEWEKGAIAPSPSNPFSETQVQDGSARQAARPSSAPLSGKQNDAPLNARSVSEQRAPSEAEKEHYRRIYAAHPDADQIAGTAAFQAWVGRNLEYQRILKAGTAQEIVAMFTNYKKQNQVQGAAIQSPKVFFKCTGPSGVLYQATPCGTASN